MGFKEGNSSNSSGLIFFIIVVLIAGMFIFSVRQENNAANPLDGLFTASDNSSFGYYGAPVVKESANSIEVYFCPQDACADKLIRKIDSAKSSLYVAIYSLTLDGISDALIRAKNRGVEVKVIFDSDQSKNAASDDERMGNEGVKVAYRNGSGYMHNKFTIIDMNVVATGSFNYSNNADTRNEENLVFIESRGLAESFKQNFESIWVKSNAN